QVGMIRPQVGRSRGIRLVVDGRGAWMEITVRLEVLGNQLGADHRPVVAIEQTSLRLRGEEPLGEPPDARRKRNRTEQERTCAGPEGQGNVVNHSGSPHLRPLQGVTTHAAPASKSSGSMSLSISLIPMNGAITPPSP